jgi:hypothetical protein
VYTAADEEIRKKETQIEMVFHLRPNPHVTPLLYIPPCKTFFDDVELPIFYWEQMKWGIQMM